MSVLSDANDCLAELIMVVNRRRSCYLLFMSDLLIGKRTDCWHVELANNVVYLLCQDIPVISVFEAYIVTEIILMVNLPNQSLSNGLLKKSKSCSDKLSKSVS